MVRLIDRIPQRWMPAVPKWVYELTWKPHD
jgi:hypothetical protein